MRLSTKVTANDLDFDIAKARCFFMSAEVSTASAAVYTDNINTHLLLRDSKVNINTVTCIFNISLSHIMRLDLNEQMVGLLILRFADQQRNAMIS